MTAIWLNRATMRKIKQNLSWPLATTAPRSDVDVNLIGYVPGSLGSPPVTKDREVRGPGQLVVGSGVDLDIGDRVELSRFDLRVVGRADGLRFLFGTPTIFMSLQDAQGLVFGGQPLATAIPVVGRPESLPPGLVARSGPRAVSDLRRPIESGIQTVWLFSGGTVGEEKPLPGHGATGNDRSGGTECRRR